jgi:hypothetical protein
VLLAFASMSMPLVILIVIVVIVVGVGLALNPLLNKKGDAAIARVKDTLGADRILEIEPKANGFGSEPGEAGGLRGMGCLAVTDTDLMFVTWAPQNEFRIARSAITAVATEAADLSTTQKAMVMVTYTADDGSSVVARWRLPELVQWLTVLGYDFGPDGPPAPKSDRDADTGD